MRRNDKDTPVSQQRLRALDDPTAAFPIQQLSSLIYDDEDEDESGGPPDQPDTQSRVEQGAGMDPLDEPSSSEISDLGEVPTGSINVAWVVLSLVGGGLLAALVASLLLLLLVAL